MPPTSQYDVLIILLDENFNVVYQRPPSSIHELQAVEIEGENPLEYIHPDDQEGITAHFEDLILNPNETISATFRAEDDSGEWRRVQSRSINLLGEKPLDSILTTIRDVTE